MVGYLSTPWYGVVSFFEVVTNTIHMYSKVKPRGGNFNRQVTRVCHLTSEIAP